MHQKSKTFRRLGVATLGAVIAVGTPAAGFIGSASAQPDSAAAIAFTAPTTGTASTLNDGTNSTIKLSVVQTALNSGTGNPALTSVRFDYTQTANASGVPVAGTETAITPTATAAPYTVNWTPPSAGTYTLTAEPLTTGGGSAGSVAQEVGVVVKATYPSVHITSPTDGATLPFFNTGTTTHHNYVSVSGTRSNGADGLPEIDVDATLYDMTPTSNNFGDLNDTVTTDNVATANASPTTTSQAWQGAVEVPTDCPTGDSCDVVLHAVASDPAGTSDEAVEATLAATAQQLSPTGLGVAPTGTVTVTDSTSATGTDVDSQTYTVTTTDTNGKPIAGLTVLAYGSAATDKINGTTNTTAGSPATATTDANGQATFTASDSADGTSTLTFETAVNGSAYVAANDDKVTRTLVTTAHVTRVLNKVVLTKTPSASVYASQSYTSDYPVVSACLTDQLGQPYHDSSVLIGQDTRTEGATVTNPTVNFGTEETDSNDVADGCFPVTLNAYPGDSSQEVTGNDAITVYEEVNGQTGFQTSSTDIGDQTTVNFAPGVISFDSYDNCNDGDCITQAKTGTVKTITASETVGGTAVAGQVLALTIGGNASFPATQPSGTTVSNGDNQKASCTTAADGTCQVNVSDGTVEGQDLEATDTHGLTGDIEVEFRSEALTLTTAERATHETLIPTGNGGTNDEDYGLPGAIMVDSYHLYDGGDANGNRHILSDVPVTVSINHGFFTAIPTDSDDYNTGTFAPAPAAGGVVGTPKDIGTSVAGGGETLQLVSNEFGVIHFATSIGQDAGFNDDGEVLTDVKVANNGTTVDGGNPAGDDQSDADYTWTTNTNDTIGSENNSDTLGDVVPGGALNGTSDTIVAVTGDSLTGNHTGTPFNEEPSEPSCTNQANNCTGPATEFYVQLKDQFGNLVGAPTTVSDTTGNAECFGSAVRGVKANDVDAGSLFSSYSSGEDVCEVFSDGSPVVAAPDTVTDTWDTQTTTFGANPDNSTGAPAFVANVNSTNVTKSDSFTIDLYSVDLTNLKFSAVVASPVKTGTTVHDEVTVADQYNQPVQGLFVTFDQSGPNAGVDNRASDFTDGNGTASDNFSSSVQGVATVTSDVYKDCFQFTGNEGGDCSPSTTGGVPLDEHVNSVAFDGVPTIALSGPTAAGKVTISGTTRAGASVKLFAKVGSGATKAVGSAQTAQSDGTYSFTDTITKTTKFVVVVDGLQTSASKTATFKAPVITETPTLKLSSSKKGKLTAKATTHPKLKNVTVHFYKVSASGHRSSLGKATTNHKGKGTATFKLTKGKTYTVVAKATGLGKHYSSQYSEEESETVKG